MNLRNPFPTALVALALVACGTVSELEHDKQAASRGDARTLADQSLDCSEGAACGQRHLLKGDACLHLAETGDASRWRCAADELETGLSLSEPPPGGERARWYANACEALRQLRDSERGAEARAANTRLGSCAERFAARVPGSVGARYYAANAGLAEVQMSRELPKETRCRTLARLAAGLDTGSGDPAFAGPLRQLAIDVAGTRSALGCA